MSSCCDLSTNKTHYYNEVLEAREAKNRNKEIQTLSEGLQSGSCPLPLQKIIEAQHSAKGIEMDEPDGQSIKIKLLCTDIIGWPFSMATRITRVAVATLCLPLSIPYAVGKGYRYGLDGELEDHCIRYGDEWKDLGVNLALFPIGVANFFYTGACEDSVREWGDEYLQRIDARNDRDYEVEHKIEDYLEYQKRVRMAWDNQQSPPPFYGTGKIRKGYEEVPQDDAEVNFSDDSLIIQDSNL